MYMPSLSLRIKENENNDIAEVYKLCFVLLRPVKKNLNME